MAAVPVDTLSIAHSRAPLGVRCIAHGFATHLHLRLPNGAPLIAFEQNRAGAAQTAIRPGAQVWARWTPESGQIVRDEGEP